MNVISKYLLGASLAVVLSLDAGALSITPDTSVYPGLWPLSSPSNDVIMDKLNGLFDPDPILAYKANAGTTLNPSVIEEGPFTASYSTSFLSTPTDPSGATISYIDGQPQITGDEIYLLVKDGNRQPIAYLFDISTWDGEETISLSGFWPGQGAISYVAILTRGGAQVPDGGATVMLLGLALSGLVAARGFGRATK